MADKNLDNNIIDIDLSVTRKKRFRIDEDNSKILELNTSDAGIVARMNRLYPEMKKLGDKLAVMISDEKEKSAEEELSITSNAITKLDTELRAMLDELFDANVSELCMPDGTAVDPFNGQFRFEIVIEKLAALYENNFNSEFAKMKQNVAKHTGKYTKSRKR